VVNSPPVMLPENVVKASVPAAMMNQVLTSWLLTTSPRLSASSSYFWVGSSVFSLSLSSAIAGPGQSGGASSPSTPSR
jgi:hypothetical protein